MDRHTDTLHQLIIQACALLERTEAAAGGQTRMLHEIEALRAELLAGAAACCDPEVADDAVELACQLDALSLAALLPDALPRAS